ncbi:MAG: amidohydrolase [Victivallaceae bacterium]
MIDIIKNIATEIEQDIINVRRDFHKYPELAYREFRTASLIARKLKDLDCEIKIGREIMDADTRYALPSEDVLQKEFKRAAAQGGDKELLEQVKGGFPAVAAIISNGAGPVIGVRVDIDALPIQESANEKHPPCKNGFASVNEGAMHACGHDAHAATGIGIVQVLMQLKDKIHGTVKVIFQPAEEGACGAFPIVQSGFLDDIGQIFAIHYFSQWKLGEITCVRYPGHLATAKLNAVFRGESAHAGGQPELGRNAMVAAANAILNLYAIPRNSNGGTRINVGTLKAGSGRNVICDEAVMEVEFRGQSDELKDYMHQNVIRVLKASAEMSDCKLEIIQMGSAPGGGSDDAYADIIMDYAQKTGVLKPRTEQRSYGSEDFYFMLERVRQSGGTGANINIGSAPGGKAHSPEFDLNESVLKDTVIFVSGLLLDIMENPRT